MYAEPVRVRFKDKNGDWIEGISEPQIDQNHFRIYLKVEAYDPDGNLTGVREGPSNLCTNQFAAGVQFGILNATPSNNPKATTGSTFAFSGAFSALTGRAGTNTTTAAVTDFALGTETETQSTVTVNANPTTGTTSGTFTVTFTITATADRAYAEVGLSITNNAHVFLLTHDVFSVLNVSNTGTLAVTYTFTNS